MGLLEALEGSWQGEGIGSYPTITSFAYRESVTFAFAGRPFLSYLQRTEGSDGRPLHTETGYLRSTQPGRLELCVAQPTGVVEILEGDEEVDGVRLASLCVGLTSTAKPVRATERSLRLAGDVLHLELLMEAVGQPMTLHLRSVLRRV